MDTLANIVDPDEMQHSIIMHIIRVCTVSYVRLNSENPVTVTLRCTMGSGKNPSEYKGLMILMYESI